MLTYILEVIFFLSAGTVLYLFISKLPVVEGMGDEESAKRKSTRLQEKMTLLADEKFVAGSLKTLRKVRLVIMKIDNLVARRLDHMKTKAEQHKEEKEHILTSIEKQEDPSLQKGAEDKQE